MQNRGRVRILDERDAAVYRSIRLEALQRSADAFGTTHEEEAKRALATFEDRIRSSWIFGAYNGDRLVGIVRLTAEDGARDRHKATLSGLYVAVEARRLGLASMLIDAALEKAVAPIEQVVLAVSSSNASALALYKQKGFSSYGIEPRALKIGSDYIDETLMVRFI